MKKIYSLLIVLLACYGGYAQDITGDWHGLLNAPGVQLRLVFHVTKSDSGYTSTMDSPDQKANGIPVTSTKLSGDKLEITVAGLSIEYTGTVGNDTIVNGTFRQGGQSFPMNLSRNPVEKVALVRPQEPKKPYPYYEEQVTFDNKTDNVTLAGTLTIPEKGGRYPAVILITGSGPQNRDEELMGHKPFLVLADHLTRNGIAVLRYDDRGTGQSTGRFASATSEDFATDVEAAINFLKSRKEILTGSIGLAGHSEGGLIAPLVASRSKDVAFIVMLAGPGITGKDLLLQQSELIGRAMGMTSEALESARRINTGVFDIVMQTHDPDTLRGQLTSFLGKAVKDYPQILAQSGMQEDAFITMQVNQLASPWMAWFIRYDPVPALEQVKVPVLALIGEKDLQVPASTNLAAIESTLKRSGNTDFTIRLLPNLNHLFQEARTGTPAEYATIEQTFAPVALQEISEWILRVNASR